MKTGLRLKVKSPKESVPRNHKSSLKQPEQRESKRIKTENDSDDDCVWDFDLDKVINANQILVKKTKARRYVFHSDERQVKVKQTK